MNINLNLKKGLDLPIEGGLQEGANPSKALEIKPAKVGLIPDDFPGLVLKPVVKEGDTVSLGAPILQDKHYPSICVTAPVAGTVTDIVRGDRRKLMLVIIESNHQEQSAVTFDTSAVNTPQGARTLLQTSGLWSMIRQRPYNIVAGAESTARDIFVSTFDTAPLAPNQGEILADRQKDLAAGVKLLSLLTTGKVYVATDTSSNIPDIEGAVMVKVSGPHPAGNTGVIAANIAPVNKGDIVWTLDGITLARIGHMAMTGQLDTSCIISLVGSEVNVPTYIKTTIGADIATLTAGRLKKEHHHERIISGNVLTGDKVAIEGYLRYPYTQITVIPEGDDVVEFMGWATLSTKKMSTSRSFPGHFLHKLFNPDARLLGGRRAMIMSGQYDKVVPMDIMTEYLIKAILSHDIEKMEALGIYEVAPEDFAVAEYVCTSKMPLQAIVAEGLQYLRKELE